MYPFVSLRDLFATGLQQCCANFVVSAGMPEDRMDEGETEPRQSRHQRASQTIREEFLKSLEVKAKDVRYLAALDLMVAHWLLTGCSSETNNPPS